MNGVSAMTRLAPDLDDRLRGELVRPGHAGYDEARRVWNGSIDRRPGAIARCVDTHDVVECVRVASRDGLHPAVRGGGHSFPGASTCDDDLVIDLRRMHRIDVDPERRVARVGAGALLGEVDAATLAHGLSVPAGIVSHTGVAGLALGGGLGWQQRRRGLTIDHLRAAMLVTADGERIRVSEDSEPELLWGLRGGGGNFGVVSEFEFELHPLQPVVTAGAVFWSFDEAPDVIERYRSWAGDAPDEVTSILVLRRMPELPDVPVEMVGELVLAVVVCHSGSPDAAERDLAPLRTAGRPLLDLIGPTPFLQHQTLFDESYPHGWHYSAKACDVAALDDDVIARLLGAAGQIRSLRSSIVVWQMGGAVARLGAGSAFRGRDAAFTLNINGNTESAHGFAEERDWARRLWEDLQPHHAGVYVNFLMDEGAERVRDAYGAAVYARLVALKRRVDPGNRFRRNQNIDPGPGPIASPSPSPSRAG